jgi:hypothetical protein
MKKDSNQLSLIIIFLFIGLLFINSPGFSQDTAKVSSPALPDNVNTIFTTSCMPCHSSKGGFMSKVKVNFSEWSQYSPEKQKDKAKEIYNEVKKGGMPPKSVRETRPEIIPTREQIEIIKIWSESFVAESKQ